jgi:hypothetical protein
MSITETQVINIMQAVHDMRGAQIKYYSHRNDYNLKVSMAKEKAVDNILQYFTKAGLIKSGTPPAAAPTLF